MKKIIRNIQKSILILGGSVALFGCQSLDQNPYEDLSTGLAFQTMKDAISWRNGFYASLRAISYGDAYMLADVQSDMLNVTLMGAGGPYEQMHNWNFNPSHSSISNFWFKRYNAIAVLNECIEKFPSIEAKEDYEKATIKYALAEAYAMRAYHFSQLVERFSPAYTQTNKNIPELGIPLTLKYDVTAMPNRASLEEVYHQILSDIQKAEDLFNDEEVRHQAYRITNDEDFILYGKQGATSFTQNALNALKARVLLNKQEYHLAYEVASELVDNTNDYDMYALVGSASSLERIWHHDATSETIMQLSASSPDEMPQGNDIYKRFLEKRKLTRTGSQEDIYSPSYVPSQWVIDLYEPNDHRRSVYFLENIYIVNNGVYYKGALVNKYPGSPALNLGGTTTYTHKPKIFRIAETYLIAAEAAYHLGDETNSKNYLNDLKTARGISTTTASGSALFEEIKKERTREFAFEGMRLNDLKRWAEPVVRNSPQETGFLVANPANQYIELRKTANDPKLVWPIPTNDMRENNNIKQNIGY